MAAERRRPSWVRVALVSVAASAFMTVAYALIHRYIGHEGFRWGESAAFGCLWLLYGPVVAWVSPRKFRDRR